MWWHHIEDEIGTRRNGGGAAGVSNGKTTNVSALAGAQLAGLARPRLRSAWTSGIHLGAQHNGG